MIFVNFVLFSCFVFSLIRIPLIIPLDEVSRSVSSILSLVSTPLPLLVA